VIGSACILLVEDEEINRVLVRTILRRAAEPVLRDARLVEAASLAQARECLATTAVDVLLLDLQLPDGSGLALVGEVRAGVPAADSVGAGPVIIMLTGDAQPARRASALAAGCDAFLDKPYTAGALKALLLAHLMSR
jgi:two-component system KDP operon response regulator KdpE